MLLNTLTLKLCINIPYITNTIAPIELTILTRLISVTTNEATIIAEAIMPTNSINMANHQLLV